MGEFDLKTEIITPESGSLVLCWDTLFLKSQDPKDKLPCHGKVGVVIKRTDPNDLDMEGNPMGKRAHGCWNVLFNEEDKTFVIHQQWLRVMEAEA